MAPFTLGRLHVACTLYTMVNLFLTIFKPYFDEKEHHSITLYALYKSPEFHVKWHKH